jgi:hypothetical protein
VWRFEVEVVAVVSSEEFRGCNIHSDLDLALVACLGDGVNKKRESLLSILDARSEATLVADVCGILTIPGMWEEECLSPFVGVCGREANLRAEGLY